VCEGGEAAAEGEVPEVAEAAGAEAAEVELLGECWGFGNQLTSEAIHTATGTDSDADPNTRAGQATLGRNRAGAAVSDADTHVDPNGDAGADGRDVTGPHGYANPEAHGYSVADAYVDSTRHH